MGDLAIFFRSDPTGLYTARFSLLYIAAIAVIRTTKLVTKFFKNKLERILPNLEKILMHTKPRVDMVAKTNNRLQAVIIRGRIRLCEPRRVFETIQTSGQKLARPRGLIQISARKAF